MAATGLRLNAITLRWDELRADRDRRPAADRAGDRARAGERRRRRARHLSAALAGAHERHELRAVVEPRGLRQHGADPAVRRVGGERRADVPERARVRRDERVQPAAVREPAVGHVRAEPVGRDLRPRARRRLRRAQGRERRRSRSGASASRRAATTGRPRRRTPRRRRSRSSARSASGSRRTSKKTGRTAPLMDGLDFHPYPVPQSLPFATRLRRRALGERLEPLADLPGVLRRVHRHAAADDRPAARAAACRSASTRRASRPTRSARAATPAARSAPRRPAASSASTRPRSTRRPGTGRCSTSSPATRTSTVVNIFHLIDETNLSGWQSGLYFADQTPKRSAAGRARLAREDRRPLPGQAAPRGRRRRRRRRPTRAVKRRRTSDGEGDAAKAKPTPKVKPKPKAKPAKAKARSKPRRRAA